MFPTGRFQARNRSASFLDHPERGYTFTESMLQLLIFSFFSLFSLAFLVWAGQTAVHLGDPSAVEWELFRREFSEYLKEADGIAVPEGGKGVSVRRGGVVIDIEEFKDGALLRKRVDRKGHEPMLTDVSSASFALEGHRLNLEVIFGNGRERRTTHTITFRNGEE